MSRTFKTIILSIVNGLFTVFISVFINFLTIELEISNKNLNRFLLSAVILIIAVNILIITSQFDYTFIKKEVFYSLSCLFQYILSTVFLFTFTIIIWIVMGLFSLWFYLDYFILVWSAIWNCVGVLLSIIISLILRILALNTYKRRKTKTATGL